MWVHPHAPFCGGCRKWTDEEQSQLLNAVAGYTGDMENINWADIAKFVPSRSGKQCREKWRNDLRPGMCKVDVCTRLSGRITTIAVQCP